MAPISASITVSFVSNYAGPHRVCWRTGGVGPYDCSTLVTCLGGGNLCSVDVPITVDNETCDEVEFDGYVQAACEVEGSLNGRVTFEATFTPDPTCDSYQILCNSVGVAVITVDNAGSGYNPASPPAVGITGGGGSGATATAVVGAGGVKTWTITNGGAGYDSGGSAIFLNEPATGGTGTGATFDVTVTAGVITSISLSSAGTSPGASYLVSDTLSFGNLGGTGGGTAVITVDSLNTSEVQYITVGASGTGYSSVPVVAIDPSPGWGGFPAVQATAEVTRMTSCAEWTTTNCDGDSESFPSVDVGTSYIMCRAAAPSPPGAYTVTPTGCCYDCVSVTFEATETNVSFRYLDCETRTVVSITLVVDTPQTVCAVNNSWFAAYNQGNVDVLVGAAC